MGVDLLGEFTPEKGFSYRVSRLQTVTTALTLVRSLRNPEHGALTPLRSIPKGINDTTASIPDAYVDNITRTICPGTACLLAALQSLPKSLQGIRRHPLALERLV